MMNSPIARPHTLAITVDNEPGALARIVGMFSARGYNIESLSVADISERHDVSRITVVTSGDDHTVEQIKAQLERLIPVHRVSDLTAEGGHVEREFALVKVRGTGEDRLEAMRLADIYRARVVDATMESFVFEITGSTDKVDQFVDLMRQIGLVEIGKSGVVAISRGAEAS
ncbi:acetolactate synthase small subunit [Pacificimonas flava]|uniref:Acetolactate synthase small subunit n=2 Tax=Pacificimonas TaxID=1960290 RepID=A0A219B870_9SPHN|nr:MULTISPECIES: acetolactate synthase small subunit [Pacificimonas]MBZ6378378.1 acetolactate synthase small subunit [Pacificimonas aurantium]OWV34316.1 acetolactate synthase small subunit [Pacificimonas flava]